MSGCHRRDGPRHGGAAPVIRPGKLSRVDAHRHTAIVDQRHLLEVYLREQLAAELEDALLQGFETGYKAELDRRSAARGSAASIHMRLMISTPGQQEGRLEFPNRPPYLPISNIGDTEIEPVTSSV